MRTYAKEGQDRLALHLIGQDGFFLDIGMGNPIDGNNSLLLEERGWRGFMFEAQGHCVADARSSRTNLAVECDATTFDFGTFLDKHQAPKVIDYISMDVDDANTILIKSFPFDRYQFKVMTFEHDRYHCGDVRKQACEEVLSRYPQYVKLLDNALVQGLEWEDWYVNADYISHEIISKKANRMDWAEFLNVLGAP